MGMKLRGSSHMCKQLIQGHSIDSIVTAVTAGQNFDQLFLCLTVDHTDFQQEHIMTKEQREGTCNDCAKD